MSEISESQAEHNPEMPLQTETSIQLDVQLLVYKIASVAIFIAICLVLIFEQLPPFPVDQPENENEIVANARKLTEEQEYRQARIILDEYLETNEDDAAAYALRSRIRGVLGLHMAALEDLDYAVGLDPKNFEYFTIRGEIHHLLGWHQKALDDYTSVLEINPNNVPVLLNRGRLYATIGAEADAYDDLNIAISLDPQNDPARFLRSQIYEVFGKYDKALEDLQQLSATGTNEAIVNQAKQRVVVLQNYLAQIAEQQQQQQFNQSDQ